MQALAAQSTSLVSDEISAQKSAILEMVESRGIGDWEEIRLALPEGWSCEELRDLSNAFVGTRYFLSVVSEGATGKPIHLSLSINPFSHGMHGGA